MEEINLDHNYFKFVPSPDYVPTNLSYMQDHAYCLPKMADVPSSVSHEAASDPSQLPSKSPVGAPKMTDVPSSASHETASGPSQLPSKSPVGVKKRSSNGCSAINCTNRSGISVDDRTKKTIRMHCFPLKDKQRCLKWITNVRRADLNLGNVKNLRICSIHFEREMYNNREDISSSSLTDYAAPTIISCPNPPKRYAMKRKLPTRNPYIKKGNLLSVKNESIPIHSSFPSTSKVDSLVNPSPIWNDSVDAMFEPSLNENCSTLPKYSVTKDSVGDNSDFSVGLEETVKDTTMECNVDIENHILNNPELDHLKKSYDDQMSYMKQQLQKEMNDKLRESNEKYLKIKLDNQKIKSEHEKIKIEHDNLKKSYALAITKYQKTNKKLNRQYKKVQAMKDQKKTGDLIFRTSLDRARNTNVEQLLDKLPTLPASLINIMLKQAKKVNWKASDPKVMELSLSIYFRSPSAYKVLRAAGFTLPHPNTLRNRFKVVFSKGAGMCPSLLKMLKLRAQMLSGHQTFVTLSLDGMSVSPALRYRREIDTVVGFEDFGPFGNSGKVANQGVVLMVRGLTERWKQIVGYYLCYHNLSYEVLSQIIEDAVLRITELGLTVSALVLDQESTQWSFTKKVGVSENRPYFESNQVRIHVVPDPPHLIKGLRNHFKDKDITYTIDGVQKIAKFKFIRDMYNIDCTLPIRAACKLKDEHFSLPRGRKMKVILACQIFSHSVASAIRKYINSNQLPIDAEETAAFVDMVNSAWDFIDSNNLNHPGHKKPIRAKTIDNDLERFDYFYNFFKSFSFKNINQCAFHAGWCLAFKSLKSLCKHLMKDNKELEYLCLRKCNQDHVENLHAQIRSKNGFNDHPTSEGYITALRCLACSSSLTELLDATISSGANCLPDEENGCNSTTNFAVQCQSLDHPADHISVTFDFDTTIEYLCDELPDNSNDIVDYIAGSIIRALNKTKSRFNICEKCIELTHTKDNVPLSSNETPSLTVLKEYKQGALIHVSQPVSQICNTFEKHFRKCKVNGWLPPYPKKIIVESYIRNQQTLINQLNMDCEEGHGSNLVQAILESYCKIRIFQEVKLKNQALRDMKRGAELNKDKKLNM